MSKKLIAVASAAALALSALVAMPTVANATGPFAVVASGQETTNQVNRNGATATNPLQVYVPSSDVLRSVASDGSTVGGDIVPVASNTAIRLDVTTPAATDAITITATGGIEIVTAAQFAASTTTTATGVQSLTVAAAAGKATVYVYTTSTTAASVLVSAAGSQRTLFVQGLSDVTRNQYKLAFTAPATGAIGGKVAVTGTVRDMFDNLLTPTTANLAITNLGGNLSGNATVTDFKVDATTKVVTFDVATANTATQIAVSIAANTPANAVTAFPGRAVSVFALVSTVDLAAQITTLNAQITALTAQLAALTASTVTKADYNKLVRKYNRTNPAKKVARVL